MIRLSPYTPTSGDPFGRRTICSAVLSFSVGAMHFFAQLSNSELKSSTQVRKNHVLRMLKQADGAKKCIAPFLSLFVASLVLFGYTL
jgi:hypothetical protein